MTNSYFTDPTRRLTDVSFVFVPSSPITVLDFPIFPSTATFFRCYRNVKCMVHLRYNLRMGCGKPYIYSCIPNCTWDQGMCVLHTVQDAAVNTSILHAAHPFANGPFSSSFHPADKSWLNSIKRRVFLYTYIFFIHSAWSIWGEAWEREAGKEVEEKSVLQLPQKKREERG